MDILDTAISTNAESNELLLIFNFFSLTSFRLLVLFYLTHQLKVIHSTALVNVFYFHSSLTRKSRYFDNNNFLHLSFNKGFFKTFLKHTQCVLGIRFLIPLFLFFLLASSSEYKHKNEVIVFLVTCFRFTIGQEKTAFSSKDQKQA